MRAESLQPARVTMGVEAEVSLSSQDSFFTDVDDEWVRSGRDGCLLALVRIAWSQFHSA